LGRPDDDPVLAGPRRVGESHLYTDDEAPSPGVRAPLAAREPQRGGSTRAGGNPEGSATAAQRRRGGGRARDRHNPSQSAPLQETESRRRPSAVTGLRPRGLSLMVGSSSCSGAGVGVAVGSTPGVGSAGRGAHGVAVGFVADAGVGDSAGDAIGSGVGVAIGSGVGVAVGSGVGVAIGSGVGAGCSSTRYVHVSVL
jgi:hypothetical protein